VPPRDSFFAGSTRKKNIRNISTEFSVGEVEANRLPYYV